MTRDIIILATGTAMVSTGIAYLCWVHLRIILLRQRLFDIRDDLWDKARELFAFDDPAYREARTHLNTTIRIAHWITLPVIAGTVPESASTPTFTKTTNPNLQKAVDDAYQQYGECVVHYLMRHTLCGLFVLIAAHVYVFSKRIHTPFSRCAVWFTHRFGRPLRPAEVAVWIGSAQFRELSAVESLEDPRVVVGT